MKFAALALALLLAVGSHAAALQADAPSPLEHVRAIVGLHLTNAKDSAIRSLDSLDDTEYAPYKAKVIESLNNLEASLKGLQGQAAPITDSVVRTLLETTAGLRAAVEKDIETLKTDMAPQAAKLRQVLESHMTQYREKLEPVFQDQYTRHQATMESLRTQLDLIRDDLRAKFEANVDETRQALMPILEAIRTKVDERLEELKALATPYVNEYKEQLEGAYNQAKTLGPDDLTALKEKIDPLVEQIRVNLGQIFGHVSDAVSKH